MLENEKNDAFVWCLYARAKLVLGQTREAHRVISEFLLNAAPPAHAEAFLLQAYLCRELGLHAQAEKAAARALELAGDLEEAAWMASATGVGDPFAGAPASGSPSATDPDVRRGESRIEPRWTSGREREKKRRSDGATKDLEGMQAERSPLLVEACGCPDCVKERETAPKPDRPGELTRVSALGTENRTAP